ncbi:60S ribosomal protein L22 [Dionaea muscipula]
MDIYTESVIDQIYDKKNKKRKKKTYGEVSASDHDIPMSAHKARRVVDQIRGRSYEEALILLEFMPYRACYPILKLISSAAANASHNKAYNKADLIISQVEVNKNPIRPFDL